MANCKGWSNPNTNFVVPTITSLSGLQSPTGSNTVVAILGTNFRQYTTIKFGTYNPVMIFINSQQIDFYIPSTASATVYPVQVFNDTYASNIVNYTIDQAPGFWLTNINFPNGIKNSNTGGLSVSGPIQINSNLNLTTSVTTIGNIVLNPNGVTGNQSIQWIDGPTNYVTMTGSSSGLSITGNTIITGNLTVTGTINGTTIPSSSDYRIKNIIEPLNTSYSVDNLKPVKYFNTITKKTEIGFIAHEVQQDFPYLVTGEKDGDQIQTLNYTGLIGVLVQEIQQLKAEVAELKQNKKS